MSEPDYLICLECETPTYHFETLGDKVVEAQCLTCGNDDPSQFASEGDFEDMASAAASADGERHDHE